MLKNFKAALDAAGWCSCGVDAEYSAPLSESN